MLSTWLSARIDAIADLNIIESLRELGYPMNKVRYDDDFGAAVYEGMVVCIWQHNIRGSYGTDGEWYTKETFEGSPETHLYGPIPDEFITEFAADRLEEVMYLDDIMTASLMQCPKHYETPLERNMCLLHWPFVWDGRLYKALVEAPPIFRSRLKP